MDDRSSTGLDGSRARLDALLASVQERIVAKSARSERANDGHAAAALADMGREVFRHLDELTSAASRLAKDLAQSKRVLDAIADGLAETDLRGTIRYANARLGAMLGVPPDFLADRPLIHFVARSDCRPFRAWLEATTQREERERALVH